MLDCDTKDLEKKPQKPNIIIIVSRAVPEKNMAVKPTDLLILNEEFDLL